MLLHSSQHTQDTVFCLEISLFHRLTQDLPLFLWSWQCFQAPGFIANSRHSSEHQGCEPNGGEQVAPCARCGTAGHWGQRLSLPSGALSGDQRHLRQKEARVARRVGGRPGSGVLSFANIIGRNIALLPTNFGQPPFCISGNILKVQDLESLIG